MTSHRLKWGPFPPNEVGRIAQHARKGEKRDEDFLYCYDFPDLAYVHPLIAFLFQLKYYRYDTWNRDLADKPLWGSWTLLNITIPRRINFANFPAIGLQSWFPVSEIKHVVETV